MSKSNSVVTLALAVLVDGVPIGRTHIRRLTPDKGGPFLQGDEDRVYYTEAGKLCFVPMTNVARCEIA